MGGARAAQAAAASRNSALRNAAARRRSSRLAASAPPLLLARRSRTPCPVPLQCCLLLSLNTPLLLSARCITAATTASSHRSSLATALRRRTVLVAKRWEEECRHHASRRWRADNHSRAARAAYATRGRCSFGASHGKGEGEVKETAGKKGREPPLAPALPCCTLLRALRCSWPPAPTSSCSALPLQRHLRLLRAAAASAPSRRPLLALVPASPKPSHSPPPAATAARARAAATGSGLRDGEGHPSAAGSGLGGCAATARGRWARGEWMSTGERQSSTGSMGASGEERGDEKDRL
uniref:Uncharacterized protein n=1 Tax=Setaria viridis TaxID=4556 RepID=A0A4U6TPA2_SETVI|nr:hypothetical protein SEVIR_7G001800v2 [Setaria viridis]